MICELRQVEAGLCTPLYMEGTLPNRRRVAQDLLGSDLHHSARRNLTHIGSIGSFTEQMVRTCPPGTTECCEAASGRQISSNGIPSNGKEVAPEGSSIPEQIRKWYDTGFDGSLREHDRRQTFYFFVHLPVAETWENVGTISRWDSRHFNRKGSRYYDR